MAKSESAEARDWITGLEPGTWFWSKNVPGRAGSDHEMQAYRDIKGRREPTAVCLFTGGTSLVSAWGITERYSEDLDFRAADISDRRGGYRGPRSQKPCVLTRGHNGQHRYSDGKSSLGPRGTKGRV